MALKLSDVVFILLINAKMPTIVGILIFISRINFMLSWVEHEKSFITSRPGFCCKAAKLCQNIFQSILLAKYSPWILLLLKHKFAVRKQLHEVGIFSDMHSKQNVQIFRLSLRSQERNPKFNGLVHECPKSYSVKHWLVVCCQLYKLSHSVGFLMNHNAPKQQDGRNRKLARWLWCRLSKVGSHLISNFSSFDLVPLWHVMKKI